MIRLKPCNIVACGYLLVISIFLLYGIIFSVQEYRNQHRVYVQKINEEREYQEWSEEISFLLAQEKYEASSLLVYDMTHDRSLFEKSARMSYNSASLVKLITALVILDDGYDQDVCLEASDLIEPGGEMLVEGSCFDEVSAVSAMLVGSLNDIAHAFDRMYPDMIERMRNVSEYHGLSFSIVNTTGYDYRDDAQASTGTAYDIVSLLRILYERYPLVSSHTKEMTYTWQDRADRTFTVSNTYPEITDDPWIVMGKTGYTDLAGGNYAALLDIPDHSLVAIVILNSTMEGRFRDFQRVYDLFEKSIQEKEGMEEVLFER